MSGRTSPADLKAEGPTALTAKLIAQVRVSDLEEKIIFVFELIAARREAMAVILADNELTDKMRLSRLVQLARAAQIPWTKVNPPDPEEEALEEADTGENLRERNAAMAATESKVAALEEKLNAVNEAAQATRGSVNEVAKKVERLDGLQATVAQTNQNVAMILQTCAMADEAHGAVPGAHGRNKTKPAGFMVKHYEGPVSYCTKSFRDHSGQGQEAPAAARDSGTNLLGTSADAGENLQERMGAIADEAHDAVTSGALDAGAKAEKAIDDVNARLKVQQADEEGKKQFLQS